MDYGGLSIQRMSFLKWPSPTLILVANSKL